MKQPKSKWKSPPERFPAIRPPAKQIKPSKSGWRNWGDHPIVVLIGVSVGVIAIIVFLTGRQDLPSMLSSGTPTQLPIVIHSAPTQLPTATVYLTKTGLHLADGNFFLGASIIQNQTDWVDPVSSKAGNQMTFLARIVNDGTQPVRNVKVKVSLDTRRSQVLDQNIFYAIGYDDNGREISRIDDGLTINVLNSPQKLHYLPGYAFVNNVRFPLSLDNAQRNLATDWVYLHDVNGDGNLYPGQVLDVAFVGQFTNEFLIEIGLQKDGRNLSRSGDWRDTIEAAVGETIQFRLRMTNTNSITVNNLVFRDVLPSYFAFSDGDPVWVTYPNGATLEFPNNLGGNGINVGPVQPNEMFTVKFNVLVMPATTGNVTNIGQAKVDETNWVEDQASAVIQ